MVEVGIWSQFKEIHGSETDRIVWTGTDYPIAVRTRLCAVRSQPNIQSSQAVDTNKIDNNDDDDDENNSNEGDDDKGNQVGEKKKEKNEEISRREMINTKVNEARKREQKERLEKMEAMKKDGYLIGWG